MPSLRNDTEEELLRWSDNRSLVDKVEVDESLDNPPENVLELESSVFVVLISPAELPTTSCVTGDMICKELEWLVSLELDCTMVAALMTLLLDKEALF